MISRVADSCFWLMRYAERAESMARLLRVNRSFLLDISLPELQQWQPVLNVSGERDRFVEYFSEHSTSDSEVVQRYLTLDDRCPVGISVSIYWARECARTIQEVISREMWESINEFWHWLRSTEGQKLYDQDRDAFYRRVKDSVALFEGICHNTMLHEEPFDFIRLGMLLERAGQTARIMDVKYQLLGPTSNQKPESAIEMAQWMALLRSCSAEGSFLRRHKPGFRGADIAAFLLKEEPFPRSIYHCLTRAWNFLRRIQKATGNRVGPSSSLLHALVTSVEEKDIPELLNHGFHGELTRIINSTAEVCNALRSDYFDPKFSELNSTEEPESTFQESRAQAS